MRRVKTWLRRLLDRIEAPPYVGRHQVGMPPEPSRSDRGRDWAWCEWERIADTHGIDADTGRFRVPTHGYVRKQGEVDGG